MPAEAAIEAAKQRADTIRHLLRVAADPHETDETRENARLSAQSLVQSHAEWAEEGGTILVPPPPARHRCYLPSLSTIEEVPRGTLAQCGVCARWSYATETNYDCYSQRVWVRVRWYHRRYRAEIARLT